MRWRALPLPSRLVSPTFPRVDFASVLEEGIACCSWAVALAEEAVGWVVARRTGRGVGTSCISGLTRARGEGGWRLCAGLFPAGSREEEARGVECGLRGRLGENETRRSASVSFGRGPSGLI